MGTLTRPQDVRGWLAEQWPYVLRLARVLTGDDKRGVTLIAESLRRSRRSWPALLQSDGLEAESRLRALLGRSAPDSARTAFALTAFYGLTTAETATILDRPVTAIAGLAEKHAAADGQDSALAEMLRVADPAESGLESRTGPGPDAVIQILDTATKQHSRRRGLVLTAAVTVLAVVLGFTVVRPIILDRRPVPTREPGWTALHSIPEPPPGFEPAGANYDWDYESVGVAQGPQLMCWTRIHILPTAPPYEATTPAHTGAEEGTLEQTRFHTRRAMLWATAKEVSTRNLSWQYSPDRWATVTCWTDNGDRRADTATLMAIADAIRFQKRPIKVAIRPGGSRRILRVGGISQYGDTPPTFLLYSEEEDSLNISLQWQRNQTSEPHSLGEEETLTKLSPIHGHRTQLRSAEGAATLEIELGEFVLGLTGSVMVGSETEATQLKELQAALVEFATESELADPADPTTWFDASEVLPPN